MNLTFIIIFGLVFSAIKVESSYQYYIPFNGATKCDISSCQTTVLITPSATSAVCFPVRTGSWASYKFLNATHYSSNTACTNNICSSCTLTNRVYSTYTDPLFKTKGTGGPKTMPDLVSYVYPYRGMGNWVLRTIFSTVDDYLITPAVQTLTHGAIPPAAATLTVPNFYTNYLFTVNLTSKSADQLACTGTTESTCTKRKTIPLGSLYKETEDPNTWSIAVPYVPGFIGGCWNALDFGNSFDVLKRGYTSTTSSPNYRYSPYYPPWTFAYPAGISMNSTASIYYFGTDKNGTYAYIQSTVATGNTASISTCLRLSPGNYRLRWRYAGRWVPKGATYGGNNTIVAAVLRSVGIQGSPIIEVVNSTTFTTFTNTSFVSASMLVSITSDGLYSIKFSPLKNTTADQLVFLDDVYFDPLPYTPPVCVSNFTSALGDFESYRIPATAQYSPNQFLPWNFKPYAGVVNSTSGIRGFAPFLTTQVAFIQSLDGECGSFRLPCLSTPGGTYSLTFYSAARNRTSIENPPDLSSTGIAYIKDKTGAVLLNSPWTVYSFKPMALQTFIVEIPFNTEVEMTFKMSPTTCSHAPYNSMVFIDKINWSYLQTFAIPVNKTMPTTGGKFLIKLGNFTGDLANLKASSSNNQDPCTNVTVITPPPNLLISCILAPGTGTSVLFNVSSPNGASVSTTFDYLPPTTGVNFPRPLSTSGGIISINGSNFGNDYDVLTVAIGSNVNCAVMSFNHTFISCMYPPLEGIDVEVSVSVNGQVADPFLITFLGPIYRIGNSNATNLMDYVSQTPYYPDITVVLTGSDDYDLEDGFTFDFSGGFNSVTLTSEAINVLTSFNIFSVKSLLFDGFSVASSSSDLLTAAFYVFNTTSVSITQSTFSNMAHPDLLFSFDTTRRILISDTEFSSNSCGGLLNDTSSSLTFFVIQNCTFSSNSFSTPMLQGFNKVPLNVSNSMFNGNTASSLFISNGNLNLNSSTFTSNSVIDGGVIEIAQSSVANIVDCVFDSNSMTDPGNGSVIYVRSGGILTMRRTNVLNHITNYGVIKVDSTMNSNANVFRNNDALIQGGVFAVKSKGVLTSSRDLFDSNFATNYGGAIFSEDDGKLTTSFNNFTSNSAKKGGGAIYVSPNRGSHTSTSDLYIANNCQEGRGGAIYGRLNLNLASFNVNTAYYGGSVDGIGRISFSKFNTNSAVGGGAVSASGASSLVIANCTFTDNFANYGGVYLISKSATLYSNDSTHTSNSGDTGGVVSAMDSARGIYFWKGTFTKNEGKDGAVFGTGISAPISNTTTLVFASCKFESNLASGDGGVFLFGSYSDQTIVVDSSFKNNKATKDGSCFSLSVAGSFGSIAQFQNLRFESNTAGVSGGVFSLSGVLGRNLFVSSCFFTGNQAVSFGGVLFLSPSLSGSFKWTRNTVEKSKALIGGAIYTAGTNLNLLAISFSNFTLNTGAVAGGAIVIQGRVVTLDIDNVVLERNDGKFQGGGLLALSSSSIGSILIDSTSFKNNSGIFGCGASFFGNIIREMRLNDTQFQLNNAQQGGGLFLDTARADIQSNSMPNISIVSSTFTSNSAILAGGGIYMAGTLGIVSMKRISLLSNAANGRGGGMFISGTAQSLNLEQITGTSNVGIQGGAVFLSTIQEKGTSTISSSTFKLNNASIGGSFYIESPGPSSIEISGTVFDSNTVKESGGAIYITSSTSTNFALTSSTVQNNNAKDGGGFYSDGSFNSIRFFKAIFTNNRGQSSSGASYISDSIELNVESSTFTNNSGLSGGSIQIPQSRSVKTIQISSSSFDKNSASNYGGSVSIFGSTEKILMDSNTFSSEYSDLGGGSIYISPLSSSASATFSFNTFTECSTMGSGGAILIDKSLSHLELKNNSMIKNLALGKGNGGGINVRAYIPSLLVSGSECRENSAVFGGCFYLDSTAISSKRQEGGTVSIEGSNFYNGNATMGAGIYLLNRGNVPANVSQSSFQENSAQMGGGMAMGGNGKFDTLNFNNNVANRGSSVYLINGDLEVDSSVIVPQKDSFYLNSVDSVVNFNGNSAEGNALIACNAPYVASSSHPTQCVVSTGNNQLNGNESPSIFSNKIIIGIVVGVFVLVVIFVVVLFIVIRRKRKVQHHDQFQMIDLKSINLGAAKKSVVDYDEIKDKTLVGAGAFGVVYRARWRETDVAVKQIKSENVSEQQLKDFLSEVAILQNLRPHPNVVLFLGMTFPPQPLAIIIEFCDGGNLYNYLRENTASDDTKMKFIINISRGMLHLHLEKIIHRDLAVRNILLTSSLEIKVSDFGLSREQKSGADVTSSETGPLKWMAPECITKREYSPKSDVFAFGVVIWEIITCLEPYADMTPLEAAIEVARNGKRLAIPSNAHPALQHVMKESWHADPKDRPDFADLTGFFSDVEGQKGQAPSSYPSLVKYAPFSKSESSAKSILRDNSNSYQSFPKSIIDDGATNYSSLSEKK
eukprot:TRINITY_DN5701_c0_g1_i1.p1 TRINITY_DN5701_c0_g1~~TRINITY_DN5701_c0_g1_i1.p1  ORF type:complete len:2449 (-),score=807.95 TRINITY_DN5701_c0_g1_i1:2-7348(-)